MIIDFAKYRYLRWCKRYGFDPSDNMAFRWYQIFEVNR